MDRILTVEQMKKADEFTINNLGFSQEELIERAGNAVANEIAERFRGGRVLVCVGKGNNGKDGNVVANVLGKIHGYSVSTLNVENGFLKLLDKKHYIIVDCIFGTGLNREVEGNYKKAIEKINSSGAYVVSCDIASGLNGNSGKAMGVAVNANLTVAIQEYKLGHFLNDGPDYSGEIVLKDIGISVWDDDYVKKIDDNDAKTMFLPLKRNIHKGCLPKVAVMGGSKAYSGSICLSLSALSAYKAGAGYSTLVVPDSLLSVYMAKFPECIIKTVRDDGENIVFDKDLLDSIMENDVIAVGMGMGNTQETYKTVEYLIKNYKGKLLIDADGLNALATYGKDVLKDKVGEIVLTPHVGEFSRLTQLPKNEISVDLCNKAKEFAKEFEVCLVLKSATSIITDGEEVYINVSGTSGMAKAGSGDVLSGFMAGVIGRSEFLLDAVTIATYVFGKAGELACEKQNDYCITASDIVCNLAEAINNL